MANLAIAATTALILAQLPAQATETQSRLDVRVVLRPASELACNASEAMHPLGITATVRCGPQKPAPRPPLASGIVTSLLFHISRSGEWLGTVDESAGAGTITSWRVIRIANRDYLEMMVGW